jgi:hypothetical protein
VASFTNRPLYPRGPFDIGSWWTPEPIWTRWQTENPAPAGNRIAIMQSTAGRAIAQAVSLWLPTAAARVQARDRSCEICGERSGTGAGFLRVLRFPLPIFIPPIAPKSPSSIIWGWYNRPIVAAVPNGPSLTPLIIIQVS